MAAEQVWDENEQAARPRRRPIIGELERLALKVRSGDRDAADELLRRCDRLCHRLAGFVSNIEPEDALQLARIHVWQAAETYDSGREDAVQFLPYAVRYARVRMLREARRSARKDRFDLRSDLPVHRLEAQLISELDLLSEVFGAAVLRKLRESLSKTQQRILDMVLRGDTQAEIAAAIGQQRGAIHRLVKEIRRRALWLWRNSAT